MCPPSMLRTAVGRRLRAAVSGGSGLGGTGAVVGDCKAGAGVLGLSEKAAGVQGISKTGEVGFFPRLPQLRLTPAF